MGRYHAYLAEASDLVRHVTDRAMSADCGLTITPPGDTHVSGIPSAHIKIRYKQIEPRSFVHAAAKIEGSRGMRYHPLDYVVLERCADSSHCRGVVLATVIPWPFLVHHQGGCIYQQQSPC